MKKVYILLLCMMLTLIACTPPQNSTPPTTSGSDTPISAPVEPSPSTPPSSDTLPEVSPPAQWHMSAVEIETVSPIRMEEITPEHTIYALSEDDIYTVSDGILYKNSETITDYIFSIGYADSIVVGDLFFSLVGIQNDEIMNMELIVYDTVKKTRRSVYSGELTNYRSYLYKLSDSEVMFSYNGLNGENRCEHVVVYNFVTDEYNIVLTHDEVDWDDLPTTTQEIVATSAYDGKIYLAKEQRIDGETHYFLTCLDSDGTELFDKELEHLKNYTFEESNPDSVNVIGDYLFFDYFSPNTVRQTFSVAMDMDGIYTELIPDTNIYPDEMLYHGPVQDRYVLFNTRPTDLDYYTKEEYTADLFVFDTELGNFRLINYEIDGLPENTKFDTITNENGDLIIYYMDYATLNRYYYHLPYEEWAIGGFMSM